MVWQPLLRARPSLDELELPSVDIARFIDMETNETIEVEPDEIRRSYRENMARLTDFIAAQADSRRIQYSLIRTGNPYIQAIEAYLGFRTRTRRLR